MTAKYHINPATGAVGICRAKIKCEFAEGGHYSDAEEAVIAAFNTDPELGVTAQEILEQKLKGISREKESRGLEMASVYESFEMEDVASLGRSIGGVTGATTGAVAGGIALATASTITTYALVGAAAMPVMGGFIGAVVGGGAGFATATIKRHFARKKEQARLAELKNTEAADAPHRKNLQQRYEALLAKHGIDKRAVKISANILPENATYSY